MPRRLAALSDRLTAENGVVLMGAASILALIYTGGDVHQIVVMYSINVFLTFSVSMLAMWLDAHRRRRRSPRARRSIGLFAVGFLLCVTILIVTTIEKFAEGGWVTLLVTGAVVILTFRIRRHYEWSQRQVRKLYSPLIELPHAPEAIAAAEEPSRNSPVAAILVGEYGGVGLHTCLTAISKFPKYFGGLVFVSVGVIDSKEFKGEGTMDALREHVETDLKRYVEFARGQGVPATYRYAIDTEAVDGSATLCLELVREFPFTTFFAGNVVFGKERWYHQILHNKPGIAIQQRLQSQGHIMVLVPVRL